MNQSITDAEITKDFKHHLNVSGVDISYFCIQNGLNEGNFKNWLNNHVIFNSPKSRNAAINHLFKLGYHKYSTMVT